MEKVKVTVTKDWGGAESGETPVLVFEIPFPDFGQRLEQLRDPLAPKQRFIKIVKRTVQGAAGDLLRTMIFLPASMHVPGFTVENCTADIYTWHEVVNAVHEALRLLAGIDYAFPDGAMVEIDDMRREAVAEALGTDDFELTVAQGSEHFWTKDDTVSECAGCLSAELCPNAH